MDQWVRSSVILLLNSGPKQLLLQPFYDPLSGITQVSRYQKDKPFWIMLKQTWWDGVAVASAELYASYLHFAPEDNHASTSSVRFLRAGCPSWHPTNSVKALKAICIYVHQAVLISISQRQSHFEAGRPTTADWVYDKHYMQVNCLRNWRSALAPMLLGTMVYVKEHKNVVDQYYITEHVTGMVLLIMYKKQSCI